MLAQLPAHLLHNTVAHVRTTTAQLRTTHTVYTTYIAGGPLGAATRFKENDWLSFSNTQGERNQ